MPTGSVGHRPVVIELVEQSKGSAGLTDPSGRRLLTRAASRCLCPFRRYQSTLPSMALITLHEGLALFDLAASSFDLISVSVQHRRLPRVKRSIAKQTFDRWVSKSIILLSNRGRPVPFHWDLVYFCCNFVGYLDRAKRGMTRLDR